MKQVINTRADLDKLKGTPAYDEFILLLKGTMTRREDQAVYPDGYGMSDYTGDPVTPVWVDVEDLSTIEKFGLTKADFV